MARPRSSATAIHEHNRAAVAIGLHCYPLQRADADYDPLLELVGDAPATISWLVFRTSSTRSSI